MLPWASVRPSSRPTKSTVPWLSPDSIMRFFTPNLFSLSRSSLTPGRIRSRTPINTFSSPSTAANTSEFPALSRRAISALAFSSSLTFSLSIRATLPTATLCPFTLATIPPPFTTSVFSTVENVVSPISSNTAFANGWSDSRSTLAKYPNASSILSP